MFERYTEKARRVIFFARYEASTFGSPYIEAEHLLLGLLREDRAFAGRMIGSPASLETVRLRIEQHSTARERISTSVDLPLATECKRVLAFAAEEAELLGHPHIGTEHLFLGLLREGHSLAAKILAEYGLTLASVREKVSTMPAPHLRPSSPPQTLRQHGSQTRLGHFELALNVADIHASLAFYAALGFRPLSNLWNDGYVVIENGHCRITLYKGQISENLLSFCGGNVSAIAEQATAAGLTLEKPPHTNADGAIAALLRDPDGNAIYLVSNPAEETS